MCNVASEPLRLSRRGPGPNATTVIDKGGPFVPLIDVVIATIASALSHQMPRVACAIVARCATDEQ